MLRSNGEAGSGLRSWGEEDKWRVGMSGQLVKEWMRKARNEVQEDWKVRRNK